MENIVKYSFYIIDIVWILPVFRQFRTKYFILFLMLTIDDPLGELVRVMGYSNTYFIAIITLFLGFLSFFDKKVLKEHWYFFLLTFFFLLASYFVTSNWTNHIILLLVIMALIILAILHNFNVCLAEKKIDIFSAVLILYFAMNVVKFITYMVYVYEEIYLLTLIFHTIEIVIGVFFVIFRADNDRLRISYAKVQTN